MFISLGSETVPGIVSPHHSMFELLNHTLLLVNPLIQKHGGFVDKYLSDGVMALFSGSPREALLCALDIHSVLEKYSRERLSQGRSRLLFAAGLHRGSLMLGTIGYEERMDTTVISDAVNIASRLQKYAAANKVPIIISGDVAALAGDPGSERWSLVSRGKVTLRGKDESIEIFEVTHGPA